MEDKYYRIEHSTKEQLEDCGVLDEYLFAVFDTKEYHCFADNPYETKISPMWDVRTTDSYVTLNPHTKGTTRADKNVSILRNFLVEFDDMGLEDQLSYVKKNEMPFTTCVFSGNKSFHFVLSLVDPVETKAEYDQLVRWLYAAVPEADPSCKNPSRFTRLGGGTHKNGTRQDVEILNKRITKEELITWLKSKCDEPRNTTKMAKQMASEEFFTIQASGYRAKMHKATKEFCKTGGRKGFRHKNVFIAACNLRDCYYTVDEAKFLCLHKMKEVYAMQGRDEEELDLKERAIEDAFLQAPRVQTRS